MIRKAHVNDNCRLAEIHVFGWRCAYKEFIPMEYLINKMTVKFREDRWYKILTEIDDRNVAYVYEEGNIIKGFMTIGDCRDDDKNIKAFELWSLYIDPLFQRHHIGTKMVDFCIAEARNKDRQEIIVWVLEKNKNAINFYNKKGFQFDGKTKLIEDINENEIRLSKNI